MRRSIILILTAFLFIGCPMRSLFPLFLEKDLVYNPSLIGTWIDTSKGEGTLTFQQSGSNRYNIISCDLQKSDTTLFEAQLGKLGKFWFIDSYIAGKMRNDYVLPVHYFSKIWVNEDTLYYTTFDSDRLNTMIEKGELTIPHVNHEGDILLTASPEELQQLVLRFADDPKAFGKTEKLIRLKK